MDQILISEWVNLWGFEAQTNVGLSPVPSLGPSAPRYVVIPWLGHYIKLASQPSDLPVGLQWHPTDVLYLCHMGFVTAAPVCGTSSMTPFILMEEMNVITDKGRIFRPSVTRV